MADKSPVNEGQCSERQKELFTKLNKLKEEVDKMRGERRIVLWAIPFLTPLLVGATLAIGGQYFKLSMQDTIRKELKENRRVEETTRFSIDDNETETETFKFEMREVKPLVPATAK